MRDYYAVRAGLETGPLEWSFDELKELFLSHYERFEGEGYFAEAYGQHCVDDGPTVGKMGTNVGLFFGQQLRKRDLWPVQEHIRKYSQADLFSVIELLYDYISKPQSRRYHDWDNCGYHYSNFDVDEGRGEFRSVINEALRDCEGQKYELSLNGELLQIPDSGLDVLVEESLEYYEPEAVEKRVEAAINKFRRYSATNEDRKDAIRTLADVLEYLRPKLDKVISSKDEDDLFNIANNFSIRHHNQKQKTDYDQELWNKWTFYTFLATIHVVLGMLARGKSRSS